MARPVEAVVGRNAKINGQETLMTITRLLYSWSGEDNKDKTISEVELIYPNSAGEFITIKLPIEAITVLK